jgi:hypothetical protein
MSGPFREMFRVARVSVKSILIALEELYGAEYWLIKLSHVFSGDTINLCKEIFATSSCENALGLGALTNNALLEFYRVTILLFANSGTVDIS